VQVLTKAALSSKGPMEGDPLQAHGEAVGMIAFLVGCWTCYLGKKPFKKNNPIFS
jgi:hypothetical protein